MPTTREGDGVKIPVTAELNKASVAKVLKDLKNLSKTSKQNVVELQEIGKAAETFSKKLSSSAKVSLKQFKKLGDQLKEAESQAEDLKDQYRSAKGDSAKAKIAGNLGKLKDNIAGLNKQISDQRKNSIKADKELKANIKTQQKYEKTVKDAAKFTGKDVLKGVGSGLGKALTGGSKGFKAGAGEIASSTGRGVAGAVSRHVENKASMKAASGDAAGGAQMMESMGAMLGAVSVGVMAIAGFVKLLAAASSHMTDLNKALMKGNGLANEFGAGAGEWTKSVDSIRSASIKSAGALLEFGQDSTGAMEAVGAFTKEASGSIIRTETQLKAMGEGDLTQGLLEFTKQATVYGKALNMETSQVASLMGKMVSEIGYSSNNVQKTMGDIVKQASQAGMPVSKFMNIFQDAIPNLDLFTNRIEELTGMMKILSKTMDPRSVKGFMSAMGRGFDQLDFMQRLKMVKIVGGDRISATLTKEVASGMDNIADQLKDAGLDDAFREAMKGPNSRKAVAAVAAQAAALGVQGSTIGQMQMLARKKDLGGGSDLDKASAIRDMGFYGRMKTLEQTALRFSHGSSKDLSGLNEHIANMVGVSGDQYKALLDLETSMRGYQSSVEQIGRTASVSINEGMKKLLGFDKKDFSYNKKVDGNLVKVIASTEDEFEKAFEKQMQDLAKQNPEDLEDKLKMAATMQMDQQDDKDKATKKAASSIEDITLEGVKATQSIGDQMENIVKFLLEKIYSVLNDVLKMIGSLYDYLPGWIKPGGENVSGTISELDKWSEDAVKDLGDEHKAGVDYYKKVNSRISGAGTTTADTRDLMNKFGSILQDKLGSSKDMTPDQEASQRKALSNVFNTDKDEGGLSDVDRFMDAQQRGLTATTDKMLSGLDKSKMMKLLSVLAYQQAQDMKDEDQRQERHTETISKSLKDIQEAAQTGDIDKRATDAMIDAVKATGHEAHATQPGNQSLSGAVVGGPVSAASKDKQETHIDAATDTAKELQKHTAMMEDSNNKAVQDYQNTSDVLDLLKKGIKFEQSWMTTKFKSVLKEASLDAFRPALTELLSAYLRSQDDPGYKDIIRDIGTSGKNLQDVVMSNTSAELMDQIKQAEHHADGGIATYTGLHTLSAGERVLPAGQSSPSGNKTLHVGGIHIAIANGDHSTVKHAVLEAMDEIARRH